MTDAEFERIKERLDSLVVVWKGRMRLGYWGLDCYYSRTTSLFARDAGTDPDRSAACKPQFEYFVASLYFNLEVLLDCTYQEQEQTVVHELAHCITDELTRRDAPLSFEERMREERVTTHVADSLYAAYHHLPVEGEY